MAQLIVRNLDDDIVRALKRRAAEHGRSTEEEHREVLREALRARKKPRGFKELLLAMPDVGRDSDFERPEDRGRDVPLS